MQTFLPYPDMLRSLECLDYRRLGKQRVESFQLIRTIEGESTGWKNHPACRMWAENVDALKIYFNLSIDLWKSRGYTNTMIPYFVDTDAPLPPLPPWFGDDKFHASHRSNLLRKDPIHYGKFGWSEPPDLPYVWPV